MGIRRRRIEPGSVPCRPPDAKGGPVRGEQPVDRGRGDPQELGADLGVKVQLAVALQGLHGLAHERREPLAGGAFSVAHANRSG